MQFTAEKGVIKLHGEIDFNSLSKLSPKRFSEDARSSYLSLASLMSGRQFILR